MEFQILNKEQEILLPHLKVFSRNFYLVGGTAISLYLGYRRSIDFDLFSYSGLNKKLIKEKIKSLKIPSKVIFEDSEQIHFIVNHVKLTFFHYPFKIEHKKRIKQIISMPNLLDLASMKAYALGHRAKWKDYVDLYKIINYQYSVKEISNRATEIFKDMFSEKIFRTQLAYFDDIDYSEEIDYLVPEIPKQLILDFLRDKSTEILPVS